MACILGLFPQRDITTRLLLVVAVSRMFLAGGAAGAVARTATAPLDRIKLLFQVQAVPSAGTSSTAYTGVGQAFRKILAEEGLRAFWKGNGLNIIRWAHHTVGAASRTV
jgi:solute carrier family 25 phosphate transporter 23/24/25/41